MKNWKRWLSIILSLVLLAGMLPPVKAEATLAPAQNKSSGVYQPSGTICLVAPDELQSQNFDPSQYQSLEEACSGMASDMASRNASVTVMLYSTSGDYEAVVADVLERAFRHNGVSNQGDYLDKHWDSYNCKISYVGQGGVYYYTLNFGFVYFTTASQEAEVDRVVDELRKQLNLDEKSDYEKIYAVYDWLCTNVRYDYTNLENENYKLKYSAYAALVNKTAVCQGYATAFYRIMLDLGVDTRVITGIGNGGRHAWNIVRLEDQYYNLDATWDEGRASYSWFLLSNASFADHTRDVEFSTAEFNAAYPMATVDYSEPKPPICYGDVNGDGKVNGQDVVLLRRYMANYDYDTGESTVQVDLGADANGDGKVNGQDVVLLRRYMANYDYDTGVSTVPLGP